MATQSSNPTKLNTITGRVILKESGTGIPDLLVVLFDLDPGARSDDLFEPSGASAQPTLVPVLGDRIGSVLTGQDGSWSLIYEDADFRLLNQDEKRPDLHIMVLAPEDGDSENQPAILFSSKLLRVNAGRLESYLIRLTSKQLADAQILMPPQGKETDAVALKIQKYRDGKAAKRALKIGIKEVNDEFEAADKDELTDLKNKFRRSILPDKAIHDAMYNFVKKEDTIEKVQKSVHRKGADDIEKKLPLNLNKPVPGLGMKINLILTEAEKHDLQGFKFSFEGKDYYKIPEAKIQEILFKRETDDGINTILFSNNPISKYCIQKSADEKCAEVHTGLKTDPGHDGEPEPVDPNPATSSGGITNEDIPVYLRKILVNKDSNQFQDGGDYTSKRPDSKSVQSNVDSFALQKGPADITAFYDFHSLQIAFEHVWHQLLDETLVNLGERIHIEQENAGKKGIFHIAGTNERAGSFENVVGGTLVPFNADFPGEVPAEIAAAFDISFLEYDALSSSNKAKLDELAKKINEYENIMASPPQVSVNTEVRDYSDNDNAGKIIAPTFRLPAGDYSTLVSLLRDQGERIIDNIRMNKPHTTNELLKELQERLLSKYEFTVFAADKDYHSVNFGLLNTYRQKWEPISYQAGKLVKTIPMAPKQEEKYSVTTKITEKLTKTQARKYNTSLQQEISSTSRAESEIIAKAHSKSNFNLNVKLDYSHINSELTFGKEAEKDSSQTKKDFREAVIKAAQEFREERSLEINTEETRNIEYSQSGTIVNPNDELSVTYLFYELQRRYRISEQLYRVMPVVLVAQEVPAPDHITEAWIIAHDWILNRVLLDDSFRPTLQYLAQRNVGDDFAVLELRKNLRQQRSLVNNLQLEFSKLRQDVDNKYAAMDRSVRSRIQEEHYKRFYNKWWWWVNNNERPNTPPDPEMAKALEQAATDEHRYAVEKAEKMALSVQREVNALNQLTSEYNSVKREHLDRLVQCRRLMAHIRENIIYYMQAIWSMEPPDQRFMRLYKVQVPYFEAQRTCIIQDEPVEDFFAHFREAGKQKHVGWLHGKVKRNPEGNPDVSYRQLVEVADLDTLLGFKGNYMIFPLKEHNALTELMAAPYIDEAFGAMDPDELSNINLSEFSRYICYLHDEDPVAYEKLKPVLRHWLERLLADPLRNGDEIIIPTGSLFIEMLPSDKSLLEDFKLKHREWDVYKVQAEVRKMELENIRYAARLLNAKMDDPDVEKQIVVNGNGVSTNLEVHD